MTKGEGQKELGVKKKYEVECIQGLLTADRYNLIPYALFPYHFVNRSLKIA